MSGKRHMRSTKEFNLLFRLELLCVNTGCGENVSKPRSETSIKPGGIKHCSAREKNNECEKDHCMLSHVYY